MKDDWLSDYFYEKYEYDRSHPNYYDNEPLVSDDDPPRSFSEYFTDDESFE